jgi:ribonuclease HI
MIVLTCLKWTMHFSWVKGHAGIDRNELVDQSEKEAAMK